MASLLQILRKKKKNSKTIGDFLKSLVNKSRIETDINAIKGIGKDMWQGFRDVPRNIKFMYQKPDEFAKGVDMALDYSKLGKLAKKGSEGVLEGMTWGAYDIPVTESRNNAERAAYTAGFTGGMAVSPFSKALSALGKGVPALKRVDQAIETGAKSLPTRLQPVGKLGEAAIRGLPFNLTYYGIKRASPQNKFTTKGDVALDTGIDVVAGGLAPMALAGIKPVKKYSKMTIDELLKEAKNKGVEKGFKGMLNVSEDAARKFMENLEKSKTTEFKEEVLKWEKGQKELKDMEKRLRKTPRMQIDKINKDIQDLWKKWHGLGGKEAKDKEATRRVIKEIGDLVKKKEELERVIEIQKTRKNVIERGTRPEKLFSEKQIEDIIGGKKKLNEAFNKFKEQAEEEVKTDPLELARETGEKLKEIVATKYKSDPDFIKKINEGEIKDKKIKEMWDFLGKVYKDVSGKEFELRENYFPMAHIDSPSAIRHEIGGSAMFDEIEKSIFDPSKKRVKGEGYVNDPIKQIDLYLDAINFQANKDKIKAEKMGIKEETARGLRELGEKIHKEYKETGKTTENIVDEIRKIGMGEGADLGEKITIKPISHTKLGGNRFTRYMIDPVNKLIDIGLYDHLPELMNKEPRIGNARYEILSKGYTKGNILDVLRKYYPDQDLGSAAKALDQVEKFGGNIEAATENILRMYQNQAIERELLNVLPKIEFPDHETKKEVNKILQNLVVRNADSDKLAYKVLGSARKLQILAKLGLSVKGALYNITEMGRMPGTMDDPKKFFRYMLDTWKGEDRYAKMFGLENDEIYRETIGKTKEMKDTVSKARKVLGKGADALMAMFIKTERFKNELFLRGYYEEGLEKGLEGKELQDYVMKKFRKYALNMSHETTPEYLENPWLRTFFQFSQYPVKDLYLMTRKANALMRGDKTEEKAAQYLIGKVLSGTMLFMMYKELGVNPWSAALSLPFGLEMYDKDKPLIENARYSSVWLPIVIDSYKVIADYLDGENYYPGTTTSKGQGSVDDYLEARLIKDIATTMPAGVQLTRSARGIADFLRGGSYTTNFENPKMRYPIENDLTTTQGIENLLKASILGTNSVDNAQEFWKAYGKGKDRGIYPNLTAKETEIAESLPDKQKTEFWRGSVARKFGETPQDIVNTPQVASSTQKIDVYLQNAMEDQMYSEMQKFENVLAQKVKDGLISQDDYNKLLAEHASEIGYDITKYRNRQYAKDLTAKDKAKIIEDYISQGVFDLADWYNSKLLTKEVAKELERQGIIDSADDLWDKAKMTDPYYRNKEISKLEEDITKTKAKMMKDILKSNVSTSKNLLGSSNRIYKLGMKNPYKSLELRAPRTPSFSIPNYRRKPQVNFDTRVNKSYLNEFIK